MSVPVDTATQEDVLTGRNHERVRGLSHNPALPDPLVLRMIERPDVSIVEVMHDRAWSDELFDTLAAHPDVKIRTALARSGRATPEQLARMIGDPSIPVLITLLEWPAVLPGWAYRKLAEHPAVKRMLLRCFPAEFPDAAVEAFAEAEDEEIATWARAVPEPYSETIAADQYRAMANAGSAWERAKLALEPDLPADLITVLATDPDPMVRVYVAMHPALSEEQRAAIDYQVSTNDRLPRLRWVVDADGDRIQRCVSSTHPGIRRSAACSRRLTAEQIATLGADDDFPVRLLLCENQEAVPADLVVRTYLEARVITRGNLLGHPAITGADLTRYADSPHWGARALVVRDRNAPAELIERLSHDEHPGVRNWVASDGRLSVLRLLELFEDPSTTGAAAANPNLPVELMVAILDAPVGSDDALRDEVLVLGHTTPTHEPVAEV